MWSKKETEVLKTMRANNEKIDYIAYKMGKSFCSVASKISRELETKNYKPWTDKEFIEAKKLYNSGLSYREIGFALNRTRESIQGKFQEERRKCN